MAEPWIHAEELYYDPEGHEYEDEIYFPVSNSLVDLRAPSLKHKNGEEYFVMSPNIDDSIFDQKFISTYIEKKFPLTSTSGSGSSFLHYQPYKMTISEYILKKGGSTTKIEYKGSAYEALVPLEWARRLVRGVLEAYVNLGSDNYVVVSESRHPHHNGSLYRDYDEDIKVSILNRIVHPLPTYRTNNQKQRHKAMARIIFTHIFKGEQMGEEWEDLYNKLNSGKSLDYCLRHTCLKHWEDRLLIFAKVSSAISNRKYDHAKIIFEAFNSLTLDELQTKTWEAQVNGYPDLVKVLRYNNESTYQTRAPAYVTNQVMEKWIEGCLIVRFAVNCYKHLTEVNWKNINFSQRVYSNDKDFQELRFFNHIVTYHLFPKLQLNLYRQLYKRGFDL